MESDLQSALDKGDMSQEVVAVSTVTALWDHVLPLPGVTFAGTDRGWCHLTEAFRAIALQSGEFPSRWWLQM